VPEGEYLLSLSAAGYDTPGPQGDENQFEYEYRVELSPGVRFFQGGERHRVFVHLTTVRKRRTPPSPEAGWEQLFNGRDLAGWKTHPDQPGEWKVDPAGSLVNTRGPGYLFTERGDFDNFHLRVVAQIKSSGGNAGVWFRTGFGFPRKLDWGLLLPAGYEAEITAGSRNWQTGSLMELAPFERDLIRTDEWFTLEVIAQGNRLIIKVNGTTTTDYRDAKSTYTKGHIALQAAYGNTVLTVRKVEIKELPPAGGAESAEVQALRDLVAARQRSLDAVKVRFEEGTVTPQAVKAAEVELLEARIRLAEAESTPSRAVELLTELVARLMEHRALVKERVDAGIEVPAALADADAKVADAQARLAKAKAAAGLK
jgi:hypothetical protein